ncbi:MAG: glycosyltransferase family 2 protein, partial [Ilumatobacteraceae bacterium]
MPRFSVVTPVHDPSVDGLRACADSVLGQSHSDWEWVISDDASSDAEVVAYLDELARDQRVTLIRREVNGGIVAATNDALRVATGGFVAFLDHDDLLTPDALSAVDEVLLGDDSIDFLYSDEDKIDDDGNRSQRFTKPAWSPERLRAQNYCSHLSVMRRALVDEVGGLRAGFDGAQDYDLVLRVSERARAIAHIPKVLYHWRMSSGSTAADADAKPYALEAGRRAVVEHLERCGISAEVSLTEQRYLRVRRAPTSHPRVSLIIPTNGARGRVWGQTMTLVENCVASIVERSTYPDLEIVVVHDMVDEALLSRLRSIAGDRLVEVPFDRPFNFSEKINLGVVRSTGSIVVPLNDDAMVASPDWVETLVAHLEEDEVGMVGPRLLLADGRIQSAGHY